MSQYRCESCDIPLTVEQLRVEVGVCPSCRAELDAGYAVERSRLLLRLLSLLRIIGDVRLYMYYQSTVEEMLALAPRAPWVFKPEGDGK